MAITSDDHPAVDDSTDDLSVDDSINELTVDHERLDEIFVMLDFAI